MNFQHVLLAAAITVPRGFSSAKFRSAFNSSDERGTIHAVIAAANLFQTHCDWHTSPPTV
jgi:hypothetical protein